MLVLLMMDKSSSVPSWPDCFIWSPTDEECSNVIYKYSCSGCSATYYGKTSRNLKIRCYEHLGTNKSGGKRACPSSSSIGDHIKQSGHEGTLEDFSIISKTSMTFDLLIHESLLIQRDRPTLNSQQSSISMVLFWPLFYVFHFYTLFGAYTLPSDLSFIWYYLCYVPPTCCLSLYFPVLPLRPFLPHLSYSSIPITWFSIHPYFIFRSHPVSSYWRWLEHESKRLWLHRISLGIVILSKMSWNSRQII